MGLGGGIWEWAERVTWALVRLSWWVSIRRDCRWTVWNALNAWCYRHTTFGRQMAARHSQIHEA